MFNHLATLLTTEKSREKHLSDIENIDLRGMDKDQIFSVLKAYNKFHHSPPFSEKSLKDQAGCLSLFLNGEEISNDDYLDMSTNKPCFGIYITKNNEDIPSVHLGFSQQESQLSVFWNLSSRQNGFADLTAPAVSLATGKHRVTDGITASAIEVMGRKSGCLESMVPVLAQKGSPMAMLAFVDLMQNQNCTVSMLQTILNRTNKDVIGCFNQFSKELLNREDYMPALISPPDGEGVNMSKAFTSIYAAMKKDSSANLCDRIKNRPDIDALRAMITKYGARDIFDLKSTMSRCKTMVDKKTSGVPSTVNGVEDHSAETIGMHQ